VKSGFWKSSGDGRRVDSWGNVAVQGKYLQEKKRVDSRELGGSILLASCSSKVGVEEEKKEHLSRQTFVERDCE
jgi:hypothetical protein